MEEEEKTRKIEIDKKSEKIKGEIIASVESIYQSIENIGKINQDIAQTFLTRIQTLKAYRNNKQMEAFDMLSELLSIQREIIEFLDTDYYKQTTMQIQTENKMLTEEQDNNSLPTVFQNKKESFWKKIKLRISKKEISSELENTPIISKIADIRHASSGYESSVFHVVADDGFIENFRYPIYEALKKIHNSNVGLDNGEIIQFNDQKNYLKAFYGKYLNLTIDDKPMALPTDEKGISNSELGKVLKFAKFLGGRKEKDLKLEVLKILRGFQNSEEISKKDRKRFKKEMLANELYAYYRDMYRKAIEEYKRTFKDFYYQRDKNRMSYKNNVRNQVKIESDGEHPNLYTCNETDKMRRTDSEIPTEEEYGEH